VIHCQQARITRSRKRLPVKKPGCYAPRPMTLAASRLIVATGLAFACASLSMILAPGPARAQEASASEKPDYEALYKRANEAAAAWKDRATRLEGEVQALRRQVAGLSAAANRTESGEYPVTRPPIAAGQPKPIETFHEIPLGQAVNLSGYGGPSETIGVGRVGFGTATVFTGILRDSAREIDFVNGRALLYKDSLSGDEVFVTDSLAVKSGRAQIVIVKHPQSAMR